MREKDYNKNNSASNCTLKNECNSGSERVSDGDGKEE